MIKIPSLLISILCICSYSLRAQNSLGSIQDCTNDALPESYKFKEYVFPEPDDQGNCIGATNNTAAIEEVFMSQTHRHAIGHPLFFTIGQRPALLQLAVTGTGVAPDVKVIGTLNGNALGELCLSGPNTLSASINLETPNFNDYFSVTLPKAWIKDGLILTVTAGNSSRIITREELKIGPYTEMNLVMVNLDAMDYNSQAPGSQIFDDFLEEVASAIPASMVRFGIFPETIIFPELVANNDTEQLVRLRGRSSKEANGITSDGYINSVMALFTSNMHRSTNDYKSTVYFGNTLNLRPGGWGGGKSFVGFDYTDIFIHELGHALSLPHWGEGSYGRINPNPNQFLYPYGGPDDNGGGRGESWNFNQDGYEFVSTTCQIAGNNISKERSDCMQRNNYCLEQRLTNAGPWDGFGDFSAIAIHRYLIGADVMTGTVEDRGTVKDFQLKREGGFPTVSLLVGKRIYTRDILQPANIPFDHQFITPGEEQLNQDCYLIYGAAHENQDQANITYKPIKFNGTLPAIIDPIDPAIFAEMKDPKYIPFFSDPRDITVKLTYTDGTVAHAINPFHSFRRAYNGGFNIWRRDVCNFSLTMPALSNKTLQKAEVYNRPFCARNSGDATIGNINNAAQNITAANFMDDAVLLSVYEFGQPKILGSNTIGNRVWNDRNKNGIQDLGEDGIAGVSVGIWSDSNGDGIPETWGGVSKTDSEGYYQFGGLGPGNYAVWIWEVDNWEVGQPLYNMEPTAIFEPDANTDIANDNNGDPNRGPNFAAIVTLTKTGEPLNDGDREDEWFDFDPGGNMTVDFGFYFVGADDDNDGYTIHEDCDDTNPKINPGATEIPNNGVDENCDGEDWNTLAISNIENPINISVYPNPVTNNLYIFVNGILEYSAQVYDLQGKLLFTGKNTKSIAFNHFAKGTYILKVQDDTSEKIVVTK